jgi:serine/threonine protein kinase
MGAVWRAHQIALDVPCALKFILGEAAASADIRSRFEREAKAAALLRSPNVVQILDHGVCDETPYIAMELLEGEDLAGHLARLGRVEPRRVASIIAQVARALTRAHAAGLVHRDMKPANIFLARDGEDEIVKVLDFGVAKQTVGAIDGNTKTGSLLGTPYYMSPEQARGTKTVDHRSDLWSLGVVVYQCITGQLPFQSDAFGDLLIQLLFNPLPVPSHVAPVPEGFDAWWARAAARGPAARFQSAKELADALSLVTEETAGSVTSSARTMLLTPPAARPFTRTIPVPSSHDTAPTAVLPGAPAGGGLGASSASPAVSGLAVSAPGSIASLPRRRRTGLLVAAALVLAGIAGGAALLSTRGGKDTAAPGAGTSAQAPDRVQPPFDTAKAPAPGDTRPLPAATAEGGAPSHAPSAAPASPVPAASPGGAGRPLAPRPKRPQVKLPDPSLDDGI